MVLETNQEQAREAPTIYLRPSKGWLSINLKELWRYRELIFFLTWRDIKVRYKQAVLGIAWAVLQPLLTTLIFTVIFGILLGTPSQDFPYPLFALTALLPWQLFSTALQRSSVSLVGNANLITKIYFPRLVQLVKPPQPDLIQEDSGYIELSRVCGVEPGASKVQRYKVILQESSL